MYRPILPKPSSDNDKDNSSTRGRGESTAMSCPPSATTFDVFKYPAESTVTASTLGKRMADEDNAEEPDAKKLKAFRKSSFSSAYGNPSSSPNSDAYFTADEMMEGDDAYPSVHLMEALRESFSAPPEPHSHSLNIDVNILSTSSMEDVQMEANSYSPSGSLEELPEDSKPHFGKASFTFCGRRVLSAYNETRNSTIVTLRCEISLSTYSSVFLLFLPPWALAESNLEQLLEWQASDMSMLAELLSGHKQYPKIEDCLEHKSTADRMMKEFPTLFSPGKENEKTAFFNWLAEELAKAKITGPEKRPTAEEDRVIPSDYLI